MLHKSIILAAAAIVISGAALAQDVLDNGDFESDSLKGCEHICCLGACCIDNTCIQTTPRYCDRKGGIFHGSGQGCGPGNCLLGNLCFPTSQVLCGQAGGLWLADTADGGVITTGPWSAPMKEAGSNYICPNGEIMVGRRHQGDENGDTRYQCAKITYSGIPVAVGQGTWSHNIKESDGVFFQCPQNFVMIGRRHKGDENGKTSYLCAPLTLSGYGLTLTPQSWSDPIKEADSSYTCPPSQLMIGRWHKGDENGDTRYLCASLQKISCSS